jgi:hypothetical protein
LGFSPESSAPAPTAFGGVNPSRATIHFGVAGSSPDAGRPRHCLAATASSSTPRIRSSQLTHVAGEPSELALPASAAESAIAPAIPSPSHQPMMNADPLTRPLGVTNISTAATIGSGLISRSAETRLPEGGQPSR